MQSLKIDPYFSPVYNRMAEIKVRKNQFSDAEEIDQDRDFLGTSFIYFSLTLARILLKQGRPDEAIKEAQKAFMLGENSPKPY